MNAEHIHNASLLLQYWSTVLVQSRCTTKKERERRTHTSSLLSTIAINHTAWKNAGLTLSSMLFSTLWVCRRSFKRADQRLSRIDCRQWWSETITCITIWQNLCAMEFAKTTCNVYWVLVPKSHTKDCRIKLQNVRAPQRMGCTCSTAAHSDYRYYDHKWIFFYQ